MTVTKEDLPFSFKKLNREDCGICEGILFDIPDVCGAVELPDGISEIVDELFMRSRTLTAVSIPEGVTTIGNWAFSYCPSLEYVSLPSSLSEIGDSCFSNCQNLKEVCLPAGLKHIGESAFYECKQLRTITLPNGISKLEKGLFFGCSSLESVTLPTSLAEIGNCAFYGCERLQNITFPPNTKQLGDFAFQGCKSLQLVSLPSSLESIGYCTFLSCSSLKQIFIPLRTEEIGEATLSMCNKNITIHTPYGSLADVYAERYGITVSHEISQFLSKSKPSNKSPEMYDGNAPYIFISYPHKDSDKVLPAISGLQSAGYNVWYDAGISTGSEWPQYIADRLNNSALVIVFISAASIESQNCRQELTFAQSLKKPILSVILDETPMPLGMQMQLCNYQSLIAYRHNSIESYVKELCSAPYLAEVLNLNKH